MRFLQENLGITGDEAAEFLEACAEAVEVDLTGLVFHEHFDPSAPGRSFSGLPPGLRDIKDLGNYPDHRGDVAEARHWFCQPRHGEKTRPPLPSTGLWTREMEDEVRDNRLSARVP